MPAAILALVVVDATPPGARPGALAAAISDGLDPLVRALEGHQGVRLGLHLSGTLGAALKRQDPDLLARMVALSRRGQLELLGGPRFGAPPAHTQWVDSVRQLRQHHEWLSSTFGTPVRGAWLPAGAWDPILPRLLHQVGLRYALLDTRLARAAGAQDSGAGPYVAERDGSFARLVAFDDQLTALAVRDPRVLAHTLRARAAQQRRAHTVVIPLSALDIDRVVALFSVLSHGSLRVAVPWQLVERVGARRLAPVAGLPIAAACARLSPAAAAQLRAAESPWVTGPAWEATLHRFDAADRLHAAQARVSALVAAAGRAAARTGQRDRLPALIERLARGQAGAALEPGPDGAMWDPRARHAAWRALAQADAAAWRMSDRPRCHVHAPPDPPGDRPTREAIVVHTPDLVAVIDPARGGAMSELTLWGEHPVHNTLARPERPIDADTALLPVLLDDVDLPTGEGARAIPPVPAPPTVTSTSQAEAQDRHRRLSFQDRMFGASLTFANLRRSQPPEIGDFADGSYRVERAEKIAGGVEIALSREGALRPAPGVEGLVRVAKIWRFSGHAPCFSVSYDLSNRSREPVGARFGVTLNLNLDGETGPSRVLRFPDARPLPMETAVERSGVDRLDLVFADAGFELTLRVSPAVTVYAYPVFVRAPAAELQAGWAAASPPSDFQGVSLNLLWPMDLWGEERRRVSIELEARALAGRR
jgi:hypothetical protein